jgi:hypothetical protein
MYAYHTFSERRKFIVGVRCKRCDNYSYILGMGLWTQNLLTCELAAAVAFETHFVWVRERGYCSYPAHVFYFRAWVTRSVGGSGSTLQAGKIASSIPDEVTGFFNGSNPLNLTKEVLESSKLVIEMCTRILTGLKVRACDFTAICDPIA